MVSMLPVSGAEQFKAEAQNKHLADRGRHKRDERGGERGQRREGRIIRRRGGRQRGRAREESKITTDRID